MVMGDGWGGECGQAGQASELINEPPALGVYGAGDVTSSSR
jgi:hypothetical protein